MKLSLQDPSILIPVGIILVGVFLFFWALSKLFKKKPAPDEFAGETTSAANELFGTPPLADEPAIPRYDNFSFPPPVESKTPLPFREPPASSPAPSKEIAERLDTMTQRLSDMQTVLQRQATTAAPGTPLSPETIDKLLKIIGNVTQQVDILQKSIGGAPVTSAPALAPAPAPAPKPAAATPPPAAQAPASAPAPAPTPGKPGVKGIGISGGALSGFPRATPPPSGTPPGGTPPAATPPPAK